MYFSESGSSGEAVQQSQVSSSKPSIVGTDILGSLLLEVRTHSQNRSVLYHDDAVLLTAYSGQRVKSSNFPSPSHLSVENSGVGYLGVEYLW